jgi:hypothetical protein
MSTSSFSALTRDLNKSKSLILAGRNALDAGGSQTDSFAARPASVGAAEDEFEELARWCSAQPGQSLSLVDEGNAKGLEAGETSEPLPSPVCDESSVSTAGDIAPILIKSVGTVKQRYRMLQREEELELAKKASRLKRSWAAEKKAPASDSTAGLDGDGYEDEDEEVLAPAVQYDIVLEELNYSKV